MFSQTPVGGYAGAQGSEEPKPAADARDSGRNIQDLPYLARDLARIVIFASTIIAAQITLALTLP